MSVRCDRKLTGHGECGAVMEEVIDAIGRVLYRCTPCLRKDDGRCWQCGRARENSSRKASFCQACILERRRQAQARHEQTPERQRQRRLFYRRRSKTEAYRAKMAAWRAANPDKVRLQKRRSALNPTPAKRERERYWNAQPERKEKKRQQALASYYARHPERPQPVCRDCGGSIPYIPPGRPKTRCDACVPAYVAVRRRVLEAA